MFDHIWPALVVLLVLVLSGYGWLACIRPRALAGPERLGIAFACGAAWLGLLTAVLGPFELFRPVVILPLLLAPLAGFLLRAGADSESNQPKASRVREWMGFLPVIPLVALSFWFAVQRPVWSIDAQRRWVLHAQWMADEYTPVPERMANQEWASTHPSYPPLIPAICALSLQLGADRDEGIRVLFPTFFFALLCVIYGYARRRAPPLVATGLTLVLATAPCFSVLDAQKGSYGLGADSALADIPLALFLTALAAYVLEGIAAVGRDARARWSLATLLGAGAILTKNEGLVYAPSIIAATLLFAFVVRRESMLGRSRNSLVSLLGVLVTTALLWKWVARNMAVRVGENYLSAGILEELASGAERAGDIANRMFEELVDPGLWGVLWAWPLFWCAWFALKLPKLNVEQRIRRALPFLWLAAGLLMVFGAYLATGWKQGSWSKLMDVSLARLLIHHAPLALILACDLFSPDTEASEAEVSDPTYSEPSAESA